MTDNRTTEQTATERLRALLDERGVEYKSHYLNTSWYAGMKLYMATDDMDGTLTVDNLTPEQAIAATLGSDHEKRLERLARSLYADYYAEWPDRAEEVYAGRMEELGIEVGE